MGEGGQRLAHVPGGREFEGQVFDLRSGGENATSSGRSSIHFEGIVSGFLE